MTQQQLVESMGLEELQYWIAYDMLKDESYREQIETEIAKNRTLEEEASAIKALLIGITK